jgi:hypothetical protein
MVEGPCESTSQAPALRRSPRLFYISYIVCVLEGAL